MNIIVRSVGLETSAALHHHAIRRLAGALERHVEATAVVLVRISDLNGPRGGVDKSCKVELRGARAAVVEARDADPYAAVDLACARIVELLRRRRQRSRHVVRGARAQRTRLRVLARERRAGGRGMSDMP